MKRLSLLLLLSLAAFGCGPTSSTDGGVQSAVKPPRDANKTTDSTAPKTDPGTQTTTASDNPEQAPQKTTKGEIAKRLYQLNELEKVKIKLNGHELPAWVMDTASKEQEGLMWVTDK